MSKVNRDLMAYGKASGACHSMLQKGIWKINNSELK